ncbi:MAG: competence/damage-inducible protein A [Gemmatimonadales bacterium]
MRLELLTIGTELLLGFTVDSNGAEIARGLSALGIRVVRRTSVGDDPESIRTAVSGALRRTGAVITTGGLGPTRDDITKKVVAGIFDSPLEFDEAVWQAVLARYARVRRTPSASNRTQAEVPRGATILPNQWGTAPGLWLEGKPGLVIMLPGVPREMRKLLHHEVLPRLAPRGGGGVIRSRTLRATGIAESSLGDLVGDLEDGLRPLTLAYLPGLEGIDLRLTAWNLPADEAESRLKLGIERLRERAAQYVYGVEDEDLAGLVLERARARGWRLAVAESCTGGLLGGRITAIPGSSDVFQGGVIAYHDAVKVQDLGVPAETIRTHGAVSEETAAAMARGVAERFGTDLGISITGIAGPSGGTPEKPVGLVCFGAAVQGEISTGHYVFPSSRNEVRARAAQAALFHLLRRLEA